MKGYLIPVGSSCNARCEYCVTRFRKNNDGLIDAERISKQLSTITNLEYIEITGGGEPLLHPKINQIVKICACLAPTRLYTNGALLKSSLNADDLSELCVSRAHFDPKKILKLWV
jgi:MoaA/NifB/PqqE/SkfB family radical SAM enzyme